MVRITSAMQMVALRETPTRQCTNVAVPFRRPRSEVENKISNEVFFIRGKGPGGKGRHELTDKVEASFKLFRQRVNAIVLDTMDDVDVFLSPLFELTVSPHGRLAYTQDLPNAQRPQQVGVVGMAEIAEVHVVEDSAGKRAVQAGQPLGLVSDGGRDVGQGPVGADG